MSNKKSWYVRMFIVISIECEYIEMIKHRITFTINFETNHRGWIHLPSGQQYGHFSSPPSLPHSSSLLHVTPSHYSSVEQAPELWPRTESGEAGGDGAERVGRTGEQAELSPGQSPADADGSWFPPEHQDQQPGGVCWRRVKYAREVFSHESVMSNYSLLTRAGDIKDEVGNYVLDCKWIQYFQQRILDIGYKNFSFPPSHYLHDLKFKAEWII